MLGSILFVSLSSLFLGGISGVTNRVNGLRLHDKPWNEVSPIAVPCCSVIVAGNLPQPTGRLLRISAISYSLSYVFFRFCDDDQNLQPKTNMEVLTEFLKKL